MCEPEVSPFQVRLFAVGSLQVRRPKVCLFQVASSQISPFQIGIFETGPFQVCAFEVGMLQLHCRRAVLLFGEIGPGAPGHISSGARQWQVLQLCVAQISATQIKPNAVALARIMIINGAAPMLVGCQQPLDIRPLQFHAFEWVDALRHIWRDAAKSG